MDINTFNDELKLAFEEIPGKHPKIRLFSVNNKVGFALINRDTKHKLAYIYYITIESDDSKFWKLPVEIKLACTKADIQSSVVNAYYDFIAECKKFGVVTNIAS